jgi:hypothetical protein
MYTCVYYLNVKTFCEFVPQVPPDSISEIVIFFLGGMLSASKKKALRLTPRLSIVSVTVLQAWNVDKQGARLLKYCQTGLLDSPLTPK